MRVRLWSVILALLVSVSCSVLRGPKTGDIAFKAYQYNTAATLYEKELATETDAKEKARKSFQIGECYRLSGNFTKATPWFKKAYDEGYDAESLYQYAYMLKMNEDYDEALTQFNNYLKAKPDDDERTKIEINAIILSKDWKKNAGDFRVHNVGALNSSSSDYAPVLYKKGIVFSSAREGVTGDAIYEWTGEHYSDIFYSERDALGNLTPPVPFSKNINTAFNEGVVSFTKDFSECYFTRCGSNNNNSSIDYCKIWHSTWNVDINDWSTPDEVELFRSDSMSESKPCLSPDGNDLYFAANTKDGYGQKDIYVSHKNADGTWTEPENLGPNINTPGEETFPYISEDGKLYFSSDGLPGMGGLDIFVAERKGSGWGKPVNLKYPINSGADDFGILIVPLSKTDKDSLKLKGYFTSNRPGGKGNDDIYEFVLKRTKYYELRGTAYEKVLSDSTDPGSPLIRLKPLSGTKITITEFDTLKKQPLVMPVLVADKAGHFSVPVKSDARYVIKATNEPRYFAQTAYTNTKGFSKKGADTVYADVKVMLDKLQMITIDSSGKVLTGGHPAPWSLKNIYYDLDRAFLRPLSMRVLDTLFEKLKDNPRLIVELGSHTDCRGTHESNILLSQHRADTAVMYLIAKGIDKDRIVAKGYGDTKPLISCPVCKDCTEEQHQQNRRTELKIIGIKKD